MRFYIAVLSILVTFSIHSLAGPPVVTNVVALQRTGTKLVDIRYDVSDSDGDTLKIRVEISNNGGATYLVPANSLSGDIGVSVRPGTGKLIVWNAGIDWDGEFSEAMRVKVIASDAKGFPGMEWGQEIPPGGFFMGKDGGVEGIGAGRHVNIPWSYWMSKYEITLQQYAEFLNTALAAGLAFRLDNEVYASVNGFSGVFENAPLYSLRDDILWGLNKCSVVAGRENLPVVVGWFGAMAFATHYGYDLPTDAEWEKAARGPAHDGLGEHWIYPWGNTISAENAIIGCPARANVGFLNGLNVSGGLDMANAYGLYDIIGNVAEWTRTAPFSLESYPPIESLNNPIHAYGTGAAVVRGGSHLDPSGSDALKCHDRRTGGIVGFRIVRRAQQ